MEDVKCVRNEEGYVSTLERQLYIVTVYAGLYYVWCVMGRVVLRVRCCKEDVRLM